MEKFVDKKRFHLIHKMVSNLDQLKGLDARYDSRDVHKGIFKVSFEGTDYDVYVTKHEEQQKKSYHKCIEINTINTDAYRNNNNTVTTSCNKKSGPIEVTKGDKSLSEIFDDLETIIFDMFGEL